MQLVLKSMKSHTYSLHWIVYDVNFVIIMVLSHFSFTMQFVLARPLNLGFVKLNLVLIWFKSVKAIHNCIFRKKAG